MRVLTEDQAQVVLKLLDAPRVCEGCGYAVAKDAVKWYGTWTLCGECKAKSVTTGWLPSTASVNNRKRLYEDRHMRSDVSEEDEGS